MNRDSAAEIETIIRPAELSIVGTVVPTAFKKRYKSRAKQNQVLSGRDEGGEEKVGQPGYEDAAKH